MIIHDLPLEKKILNVRQLLKRATAIKQIVPNYTTALTTALNQYMINPFSLSISQGNNSATVPIARGSYSCDDFVYWGNCFFGFRGGVRIKLVPNANTVATQSFNAAQATYKACLSFFTDEIATGLDTVMAPLS